jgi:hypothetical protein
MKEHVQMENCRKDGNKADLGPTRVICFAQRFMTNANSWTRFHSASENNPIHFSTFRPSGSVRCLAVIFSIISRVVMEKDQLPFRGSFFELALTAKDAEGQSWDADRVFLRWKDRSFRGVWDVQIASW